MPIDEVVAPRGRSGWERRTSGHAPAGRRAAGAGDAGPHGPGPVQPARERDQVHAPGSPIEVTARRAATSGGRGRRSTDRASRRARSDRIFERFYRAPRRGLERRAGLGLAICRGIVDAHGGDRGENRAARGRASGSRSPCGGGAAFGFALPLQTHDRTGRGIHRRGRRRAAPVPSHDPRGPGDAECRGRRRATEALSLAMQHVPDRR